MSTALSPPQTSPEDRFDTVRQEISDVLERTTVLLDAELRRNRKDSSLQELLGHFDATRAKYRAQRFQIAVIALMKAGKSTLINAWLGGSFLPSSNEAQTARIVRIRHAPEVADGRLRGSQGEIASGALKIDLSLRELNAQARQSSFRPPEDELVLEAPLASLAGRPLGQHGFEILDTPGPNEAGAEPLRARIERLLHEVDVIVYLLDYTRLKSEDDRTLFEKLTQIRPDLLRDLAKRLFFVVNKIDAQNRNGLDSEETAAYVSDLLRQQLSGIKIGPDRVLAVSAEQALLARLVESGKASPEEVKDFARIAFGQIGAKNNATLEKVRLHAPGIFESSGMALLEEVILSHVYEHRGQILLQGLLEDLGRHLDTFYNRVVTAKSTLKADRENVARQLKELKSDLATIRGQLQSVAEASKRVQKEIESWIKKRFAEFQQEVNDKIDLALQGKKPEAPKWRLRSIFDSFAKSFQKLVKPQEMDQEKAHDRIRELNAQILEYLRQEFQAFQVDIEQEAHGRQSDLFTMLEKTVEPLLRRIEQRVGEHLRVTLRPVAVEFPLPSLEELHRELEASGVNRFVDTTRKEETFQDTESRFVKGGWCEDDRWVDVQVEKTRTVEKHSLSVDRIRASWTELIDQRTRVSTMAAVRIVGEQISKAVRKAEERLQEYADGYTNTIEQEIRNSNQGEEQRRARLQEVEALETELSKLIGQVKVNREYLVGASS